MSPIIVPAEDALTQPFWEGARLGELRLQVCARCGNVWHPPLPLCPRCQSWDVVWRPARGDGDVHSFTIVHHPAHAAVRDRTPYLVALVRLAEGPLFICNIRNCPMDEVRIGLPVKVLFETIAPGVVLPQFEPR